MNDITVRLTDEDAHANYPFPYQVRDRVRLRRDGREGVVENATFAGKDNPGGSFEITYEIRFDDVGVLRLPMADLEKIRTTAA